MLIENKRCNVRVNVTLMGVRATTFAAEKQYVLRILSVSVHLDIHHTKRMSRIIFSTVAPPVLPYFSTLSDKGTIFFTKILNLICVLLIFATTFV